MYISWYANEVNLHNNLFGPAGDYLACMIQYTNYTDCFVHVLHLCAFFL